MFARSTAGSREAFWISGSAANRREIPARPRIASSRQPGRSVRVFERRSARPPLQSSRSERLVFTVITIDLPAAQSSTGIHDLPPIAPEHTLDIGGGRFQYPTAPKRSG